MNLCGLHSINQQTLPSICIVNGGTGVAAETCPAATSSPGTAQASWQRGAGCWVIRSEAHFKIRRKKRNKGLAAEM